MTFNTCFSSFPICVLSCHRGKRETRPTRASVSSCWIGNQASAVLSCEKPRAVATSLIDPFDPGGRGAVSPGRSLLRCLNRPQAKTSALPLLTPVYPPEGLPFGATPKLLYEPNMAWPLVASAKNTSMPARPPRRSPIWCRSWSQRASKRWSFPISSRCS